MQCQTERRELNDLTPSLGYAEELSLHGFHQQRVLDNQWISIAAYHFNNHEFARIMRMNEAGLMSKWYKEGSPDIHQCEQTKKQIQQQQSSNISPLNLKSLAAAFGALVIGFITASLVLITEKIRSVYFR